MPSAFIEEALGWGQDESVVGRQFSEVDSQLSVGDEPARVGRGTGNEQPRTKKPRILWADDNDHTRLQGAAQSKECGSGLKRRIRLCS